MNTEQYLLYLLKTFISQEEEVLPPPAGVSLKELYESGQKHNVAAMLYGVLRQAGLENEVLSEFREAMVGAVYWSAVMDGMVSEVMERLEAAGIPYTILKGYRLKEIYPVPELRTMGDVDFLIREADRNDADRLLLEAGYEREPLGGSTWVYKQAGVTLEFHTKLASGDYWNEVDYEGYFLQYFSRLQPVEGCSERRLRPEEHFIFLLFHLAKHLNSSGAGIRMVLDLAVFLKKYQDSMDWEFIRKELAGIRLQDFAEHILSLCGALFLDGRGEDPNIREQDADAGTAGREQKGTDGRQVPESDPLQRQLLSYIMQGGIFGFERPDSIRRLRGGIGAGNVSGDKRIRAKAALKLMFPGRKHMVAFLPALEHHPWLLPVAWIRRWRMGMQQRERVEASLSGFRENVDEAREQYFLLKKIGL